MKPLFVSGPSLNLRVTLLVLISISLMIAEYNRSDSLKSLRTQLSALVYPIQYLVNLPVKAGQWLSVNFNSRMQLLSENARLHEQNQQLLASQQQFEELNSENTRLRKLLGASARVKDKVQMAEVMAVRLTPFSRKISINKGKNDGVFEGQSVIDAYGVLGQVIEVGLLSSVVRLIVDSDHKLPVQVVRTGRQAVAEGKGIIDRLNLLYLPNQDIKNSIKVGDLLVTSGQGGHFPPGYPVGIVEEVNLDIAQPYAQVQAVPKALLERNREVLLIWTENSTPSIETVPNNMGGE